MPSPGAGGNGRQQEKWTVMVFMGAATIKGNAPLKEAAESDLAEMAAVGSGRGLNVFVQVHQGGDFIPRRARVVERMRPKLDRLPPVPDTERVLTGGHALLSFIRWSLRAARHQPINPKHYS